MTPTASTLHHHRVLAGNDDDGGEFPPNYDPAHGQCKGITSNQTYVLVELSKSGEVREKELGEPRG